MTYPENKLVIAEGDSLSLSVLIEEDDEPKNLLGSQLFFSIKKSPNDNDRNALLRVVVPFSPNFTAGSFPIFATPEQMRRIRAGSYFYDLRLTKGGAVSTLAASSPLEVVPVITDHVQ